MDLGIARRTAFVAASSQGLGFACARSLAREGVAVTLNGRDAERLALAADRLRGEVRGADVRWVAADITDAAGREAVREALPDADILITNNAGPAPAGYDAWTEDALVEALRAHTVPAVELIHTFLAGMRTRRFGRIVNITSAMVKSPAPEMGLSSSARAALTALAKSLSIEVAADNVTVNNLLPERFDTERQHVMIARRMHADGVDEHEARARTTAEIPAQRFGRPDEFGDACAFLCSAQAGYITGQNLQLDGGSYRGLI
jgi:3-oxoacyl-[acyl-carrier protein] reductase